MVYVLISFYQRISERESILQDEDNVLIYILRQHFGMEDGRVTMLIKNELEASNALVTLSC